MSKFNINTTTANPMEYDVQSSLKKYMPGLLELLGTQNISWTRINNNLGNNLQEIKRLLNSGQNPVLKDVTFYSIIVDKLYGSGFANGMFDWFREIFESLSSNLTVAEKELIRAPIYSVLAELDKGYLNFMGELATLNEIKKIGRYELINIEEQIQPESNKCADFLFLDKKDEKKNLLEIVNLHLYLREIESDINIKQFIEGKLNEKMKTKFISPKYDFYLQPVLWIKSENELELLQELYSESGLEINNILAPFVYFTYKDLFGKYEHHFDRIY